MICYYLQMTFQLGEQFSDFNKVEQKYKQLKKSQAQLGYNLSIKDLKLWKDTDNEPLLKKKNKYKYIIIGCESMGNFSSRGQGCRNRK